MLGTEVISLVHAAFGDMLRPDDASLLHPQCCDDSDICSFYGVEHWQDVGDDVLERENAALCFFSPEAFRFFLPAFLVWILKNYTITKSFTVDSTIYSLDPGYRANAFKMSKLGALTLPQREAVIAFLTFMSTTAQNSCDVAAARSAIESLRRSGW